MSAHQNTPVPEAVAISFETYPMARTRCTMVVEGALIQAEDGRDYTGYPLVGHGAVAAVMERQVRDEVGPFRGIVVKRDDHLEVEAIWDGDCLIDGEGADIAAREDSVDED